MIGRIQDRATFGELRRHGRGARVGPVSVRFVAGPPLGAPRVAFAVGRPFGSAVDRNRARRRIRAIMTELAREPGGLEPGAYLVRLDPAAAELDHAGLDRHLRDAVDRLREGGR